MLTTERLAIPSYTPLADELKSRFLDHAEPIARSKDFKIYPVRCRPLPRADRRVELRRLPGAL